MIQLLHGFSLLPFGSDEFQVRKAKGLGVFGQTFIDRGERRVTDGPGGNAKGDKRAGPYVDAMHGGRDAVIGSL